MSHNDYEVGRKIATCSFPAIIMGFMRIADDDNLNFLRSKYPNIWNELQERYNNPGGYSNHELTKLKEKP
jgi:hypothetical protein